jgi:hypothetical protein
MKIEGKVTSISGIQTFGTTDTKKQSILVTELTEKYPNSLYIDFLGDENVNKLNGIDEGDVVSVEFNTGTNQKDDRVFNNIKGRRVDKLQSDDVL